MPTVPSRHVNHDKSNQPLEKIGQTNNTGKIPPKPLNRTTKGMKAKTINVTDKVSQWLNTMFEGSEVSEQESSDNENELGKQKGDKVNKSRKTKRTGAQSKMSKLYEFDCFSRKAMQQQRRAVDGETSGETVNPGKMENRKKPSVTKPKNDSERIVIKSSAKQAEEGDSDGESTYTIKSEMSQLTRASSSAFTQGKGIVKSGFLGKPRSSVLVKQCWPHMNQDPRYVTQPLSFNQLNFAQFVGGECRTIMRTKNETEIYGRLRVLSKISYLYDVCGSWERAKVTYFAILGSIEEGEANWTSSFSHYDLMCPPPVIESFRQGGGTSKGCTPSKKDFFCKDFQKGECSQVAPHKMWIRNSMENVEHFCANCFQAKMGKIQHVPGSTESCVKK